MSRAYSESNLVNQNCSSSCYSCTKNFNPLLKGVQEKDRSILDSNRVVSTYKKGEIIFKEGTFPAGLFCLNSGKVMTFISDTNGNKAVTHFNKGVSFLGISDFLSGTAYHSTCIALTDCNVCMIRSDAVEQLMSNNSTFSRKLLTRLASDNQQCSKRLLNSTKQNMNVRIADALLELIHVFGTDDEGAINVYLKRAEIALLCNMNETNVIRHLSALDKSGAITLNGKKIVINDKDILLKESSQAL